MNAERIPEDIPGNIIGAENVRGKRLKTSQSEKPTQITGSSKAIDDLMEATEFQNIFGNAEQRNFQHPFGRILERAVNPQVATGPNTEEMKPLYQQICSGFDIDLISRIHRVWRQAIISKISSFGRNTRQGVSIEEQLKADLRTILAGVSNRTQRNLYLEIANRIIGEKIFHGLVSKIDLK